MNVKYERSWIVEMVVNVPYQPYSDFDSASSHVQCYYVC